jgi:hypothetical protein
MLPCPYSLSTCHLYGQTLLLDSWVLGSNVVREGQCLFKAMKKVFND